MGRQRQTAAECNHKENDICLIEKFLNGINDDIMVSEIIKELTVLKNIGD